MPFIIFSSISYFSAGAELVALSSECLASGTGAFIPNKERYSLSLTHCSFALSRSVCGVMFCSRIFLKSDKFLCLEWFKAFKKAVKTSSLLKDDSLSDIALLISIVDLIMSLLKALSQVS